MRDVPSDDEVIHLREWGSERIHPLPHESRDLWIELRDASPKTLAISDQMPAHRCALLTRTERQWSIHDLGTDGGLQLDGTRRPMAVLEPGLEIAVRGIKLVAESRRTTELRRFCWRILGWAQNHGCAIDSALRSIRLGATRRAALVLCGNYDVVPIATALHRRTLGAERPIIVCDPRRGNQPASVRSPAVYVSGMSAFQAALGGTLCVRRSRLPRDFRSVVARLRALDPGVQLVIGADLDDAEHLFLTVPAPLRLPSLADRSAELPRIIDEYAGDAIAELGAPEQIFSDADRQWVLEQAPTSLAEIEKATLRAVALKSFASVSSAARWLGMAPISLSRWIRRRPGLVPP